MLFDRRQKPTMGEKVRSFIWPRTGWRRAMRYFFRRVLRLTGSPYAIAIGFAMGSYASFTPFVGFHFIISFILAFIVRGNMIAAALGTAVGNPLTFPFIWGITFKAGSWVLGGEAGAMPDGLNADFLKQSFDVILPVIGGMLTGSLIIGGPISLAFYFLIYYAVRAYQRSRTEKMAQKVLERQYLQRQQEGETADYVPRSAVHGEQHEDKAL